MTKIIYEAVTVVYIYMEKMVLEQPYILSAWLYMYIKIYAHVVVLSLAYKQTADLQPLTFVRFYARFHSYMNMYVTWMARTISKQYLVPHTVVVLPFFSSQLS